MIKNIIRKLLFGYRCSSDSYVEHLKKCGVQIGENVEIFCPKDTVIETLNPHLLTIGNNVSMTGPVTILNHDYSVCVLKNWTGGEILGKQKKTIIGNNVFLGWGCIVLPGAIINDNTIIGAYSVVAGEIEGEAVYAGNPARKLFPLAEYYKKIKRSQLDDACNVYTQYKTNHGCRPPIEVFHEYFFLFEQRPFEMLPCIFQNKFYDHGSFKDSLLFYNNHRTVFSSYNEFCSFAEMRERS